MRLFPGLHGLTYVDKTQGGASVKEENEIININGFVDRVYRNAPDTVNVELGANQKVILTKVTYSFRRVLSSPLDFF